jgi:hypothetical protein
MPTSIKVSRENSIPMRLRNPITTREYGSFKTGLRPNRMPSTTSRTMEIDWRLVSDHEFRYQDSMTEMVSKSATHTPRPR